MDQVASLAHKERTQDLTTTALRSLTWTSEVVASVGLTQALLPGLGKMACQSDLMRQSDPEATILLRLVSKVERATRQAYPVSFECERKCSFLPYNGIFQFKKCHCLLGTIESSNTVCPYQKYAIVNKQTHWCYQKVFAQLSRQTL